MNIKIIMVEPYPFGMACTARIHNYAKGIKQAGGKVQIIIPKPTEPKNGRVINKNVSGSYQGIEFQYSCGKTILGTSFLQRRIDVIKGLIGAAKILLRDRTEINALLLVGNSLGYIIFFKIMTFLLKIKYLQEKSELPFINRKQSTFLKLYYNLYTTYIFKCFDGILVISQYLYDYLKPRIRKDAQLLLVPIIVDLNEFKPVDGNSDSPCIVYCGNLSQKKDGVLTLIRAFKEVSDNFPKLKLYLAGNTNSESDREKVKSLIAGLNLDERIICTGYVSRKKLKGLLCNATLLALAKPSSLQADSCFPSKLAEYLATGKPVVATKTGEIPYYLKDLESAFLAEADSVDSFASKLHTALANPGFSNSVGMRGREIAEKNFDYILQADRILNFIDRIYPRYRKRKHNFWDLDN